MKLPWAPRKQGHQARMLKDYFQQLQLQRILLHTELHFATMAGSVLLLFKREGMFQVQASWGIAVKMYNVIPFKAYADSSLSAEKSMYSHK